MKERFGSGTCRYCGCQESHACTLPDGEACAWFDAERTVCTAPACMAAYFREEERERRRRERIARGPRRRSPAEILELRKQEQAARRRRTRGK